VRIGDPDVLLSFGLQYSIDISSFFKPNGWLTYVSANAEVRALVLMLAV